MRQPSPFHSHVHVKEGDEASRQLGVVQDAPERRSGGVRKQKLQDLVIHMERAGTHGGELRYLIQPGQALVQRI